MIAISRLFNLFTRLTHMTKTGLTFAFQCYNITSGNKLIESGKKLQDQDITPELVKEIIPSHSWTLQNPQSTGKTVHAP